ncbi:hypothetical protein JAO10_07730 [Burkholderia contaminans]|jgi:hypothetical protein|uniref:Peptidyl-prolyl cis-trans isomerase D n=1 Tax=Corchorus capsularis TaxID=210143 RepID=A0A1R3KLN9_COCAP|nr:MULTISPECIES: hypothetical protein [Burkholderia cepacia complex]OMP08000.1 peptidyl-prolyl cis-trans isomerase D [Corchorus capsularis]MBH9720218.1 hypothetical protein [Burkholderia contaminans]MBR8013469.1 hypothetical protein [Burkholderia vietnamiensis]HDR9039751.1 hypothetical protein [Burkholderia vietnamiensis]HDR9196428.1 hypothetical protein [Burkholderia vietnamiensis]
MSFLDNAKEVLTEEEFTKLQELQTKSSDFEATPDEEKNLLELKNSVREKIAQRDKAKNLSFLNGKVYTIAEIITAGGYSNEEIKKYYSEKFPRGANTEVRQYATIKFKDKDGKEVEEAIKTGERISKGAKEAIKKMGVAKFVELITDKAYFIDHVSTPTVGIMANKKVYKHINEQAKRLEFDVEKFKQALGIKA